MAKKNKESHGLHIAVCIKPVPDPSKWDKLRLDPETMLLDRSAIPAVINALDLHAIEQALQIKEQHGGTITLLTMAPPEAVEQLREALAMGCDRAYLLSDRAFAGADTLATARVLAAAIGRVAPVDLVFCGQYSLDGSTSQVGPQLAELLQIPDLIRVIGMEIKGTTLRVTCRSKVGETIFASDFPSLLTFDRDANRPRLAGMAGIRRAMDLEVACWGAADLALDANQVGLLGSPTRMLNVFTPAIGRKGEMLQGSVPEMVSTLIDRLKAESVLE